MIGPASQPDTSPHLHLAAWQWALLVALSPVVSPIALLLPIAFVVQAIGRLPVEEELLDPAPHRARRRRVRTGAASGACAVAPDDSADAPDVEAGPGGAASWISIGAIEPFAALVDALGMLGWSKRACWPCRFPGG